MQRAFAAAPGAGNESRHDFEAAWRVRGRKRDFLRELGLMPQLDTAVKHSMAPHLPSSLVGPTREGARVASLKFARSAESGAFREMGIAAVLAAVVLFVSAVALLGANISQLRDSYARVQNSNAALLELSAVHTQTLQIEMTIRGYLLSGDRDFLMWGANNRKNLQRALDNLTVMFADDPVQSANLAKLRRVMVEYHAKFSRLPGMSHDESVAMVVKLARTNPRAPMVRALVAMQNDEKTRLAERVRIANDNVRNTSFLAFGIIALAVLAGAFGLGWMLNGRRAVKSA